MRRPKGDRILLRNRRLGRISYVFPLTAVKDESDYSALFLAAGTRIKQRVMPDGSPFTHDIPYAEKHEAAPCRRRNVDGELGSHAREAWRGPFFLGVLAR